MSSPSQAFRVAVLSLLGLLSVSGLYGQGNPPKPLAIEGVAAGPVFHVPIEGTIDNALAHYVERAVSDAEQEGAAVLLLHVDTYGGLVDAADAIRKTLLNTTVPTVALVDRNAASAGALISYAADRIAMVPGSSIGAATVVEGGTGEAAPDKYQSYMRGLMRATAEANGRDPQVAEAMVDEDVEVPGVKTAGKVLTLSAQEAHRLGVADGIVADQRALLREMDLANRQLVMHRASQAEQVLRFLGSPVLQSLFMLMMLSGLLYEMKAPGLGLPGLVALVGAALFFAPNYLLGLVESWEIVVFFIGVVLLVLEVFILPGFGVPGVAGIVLVVGSLIAALVGNVGFQFPDTGELATAVATMAVTLVLLILLIFSVGRYLPSSSRVNRLVLATAVGEMRELAPGSMLDDLPGRTGLTLTPLRPAGTAEFDGARVDVITSGEYVPPGQPVEVVRVRGRRVEVRLLRQLTPGGETIAV